MTTTIGIATATMVIAKLVGERDDTRLHAALDNPTLVRNAIEQETTEDQSAFSKDHELNPDPSYTR
ncbi:hypothetical protein [Nocardia sp. NPDC005998]|uniref:hypothetical protein n=1 Tax=Nocardia sp. NPDC005998 TaxID=3156894 RepID=UPI0033A80F47